MTVVWEGVTASQGQIRKGVILNTKPEISGIFFQYVKSLSFWGNCNFITGAAGTEEVKLSCFFLSSICFVAASIICFI